MGLFTMFAFSCIRGVYKLACVLNILVLTTAIIDYAIGLKNKNKKPVS